MKMSELTRVWKNESELTTITVERYARVILFGGSLERVRWLNRRIDRLAKLSGRDRDDVIRDLRERASAYYAS